MKQIMKKILKKVEKIKNIFKYNQKFWKIKAIIIMILPVSNTICLYWRFPLRD